MSLLSVVQDVCLVVGVQYPTSVLTSIASNRTMQEMLGLAIEMAQRIAYDYRDWTALRKVCTFTGNGTQTAFNLPADYKRMLLTANVRSSTTPTIPLKFISDLDQWLARRAQNWVEANGEWTIVGGQMLIWPAPGNGVTITFPYLDKNPVALTGGGNGDRFMADNDSFRLDDRLLRLGMIWQWKSQKGSPYQEDLATFGSAITTAMGKDSPSPIIIDSRPSSWAANVAYPFPVPTP